MMDAKSALHLGMAAQSLEPLSFWSAAANLDAPHFRCCHTLIHSELLEGACASELVWNSDKFHKNSDKVTRSASRHISF